MNKAQLERAGIRAMLISIGAFFAFLFAGILAGMNGKQLAVVALAFITATICASWIAVIALCELDYDKRHPSEREGGEGGAA